MTTSDRFGLWREKIGALGCGGWCGSGDGSGHDLVSTREYVERHQRGMTESFGDSSTYEVRPYPFRPYPPPAPSPLPPPDPEQWEILNQTRRQVVSAPMDRAGAEWLAGCFARNVGETFVVQPVSSKPNATFKSVGEMVTKRAPVIDAAALAYALFSSDPDVEAFVTGRRETEARHEATMRIAFDLDERGWASIAKVRAARVIARMR